MLVITGSLRSRVAIHLFVCDATAFQVRLVFTGLQRAPSHGSAKQLYGRCCLGSCTHCLHSFPSYSDRHHGIHMRAGDHHQCGTPADTSVHASEGSRRGDVLQFK